MAKPSSVAMLVVLVAVMAALRTQNSAAPTATNNLYIGFLDDAREEMVNGETGVAHQRVIRPAFEKVGAGWRLVESSSLPARMTWTVAFDGRSLGLVMSQAVSHGVTPDQSEQRHLTAVQVIATPATAIPAVGQPSKTYGGLMAMWPGVFRRPLVVVSKPYVTDPDGWKRVSQLPNKISALVRAAFRRDFPHVIRCKEEEVVQQDWNFPDSSLALPVAYASNKGLYLIESRLSAGDCGYIDDPEDPLSGPWFFVSADGKIRRIGSFMSLLDAGDYDNDGKSEVIFFLSQPEDTDGFVLFDGNLNKQASLLWSYH